MIAWLVFGAAPEVDGFRYQEQVSWYSAIGSSYHVGVDGLSLSMVLLTTLLAPLAILASFSVEEKIKPYMALFLALETGMLGVFLSLDLLLFFVFWEIGLVPMYFLIDQWGSKTGERELWGGMKVSARRYASFKFIIYTMAGSLGLLLAIQMLGVVSGTFDLVALFQSWPSLTGTLFGLQIETVKTILGIRDRFCYQSASLAFPHLVAGCPHRSANCGIDDTGWRAVEIRRLWFLAPGAATLS